MDWWWNNILQIMDEKINNGNVIQITEKFDERTITTNETTHKSKIQPLLTVHPNSKSAKKQPQCHQVMRFDPEIRKNNLQLNYFRSKVQPRRTTGNRDWSQHGSQIHTYTENIERATLHQSDVKRPSHQPWTKTKEKNDQRPPKAKTMNRRPSLISTKPATRETQTSIPTK